MQNTVKIRAKLTGRGTVRNPDGTTKQIVITGEKLMTEQEARKHGYNPERRS